MPAAPALRYRSSRSCTQAVLACTKATDRCLRKKKRAFHGWLPPTPPSDPELEILHHPLPLRAPISPSPVQCLGKNTHSIGGYHPLPLRTPIPRFHQAQSGVREKQKTLIPLTATTPSPFEPRCQCCDEPSPVSAKKKTLIPLAATTHSPFEPRFQCCDAVRDRVPWRCEKNAQNCPRPRRHPWQR